MMDTVKHILSSLGNYGAVTDAPLCQFWKCRGVYVIQNLSGQTANDQPSGKQSFILKQLKLGAIKAFLVGELLAAGETAGILPVAVKVPGGYNYLWFRGNRYLLTGKIEGQEADYYRIADLQAAIRAMKVFHRFTENLLNNNGQRWSFLKFDPAAQWRNRLREMEICREMALRELARRPVSSDWCRQYPAYWPAFYRQAREAVAAAEGLVVNPGNNTQNVICYHDWAYHNVIINGDRAFLIDFDEIIVDRAVHDKANLIGRYLRLNGWSAAAMAQIIEAFDRFYGWQPGELKLLRIYLSFPYDFWMLGRQYFIEKQPWSRNYFQDQWDRKIARQIEHGGLLEELGE